MVAINYAKDIRVGEQPAKAAALGSNFVWPALPERLFLRGQSMVYDFVGQKYAARLPDNTIDYTTDVNDLGIVTRASTATYWGPEGTLLEAAVDEARIQHVSATGEPLGVLVESEATNLVVNANLLALPGGTSYGYRFIDNAAVTAAVEVTDVSGGEGTLHASVHTPGNSRFGYASALNRQEGLHTMSVFLRAVEGQSGFVTMRMGASGSAYTSVFVDDSRWHRAEFSAESSTQLSHFYICDRRVEDSALNNLDEFYFCFAQVEAGSYLTSYIPTIDSPVTRAADEVSIDLSDVFNPDEGTLRITAQVPEGEVVASLGNTQVVSDSDEFKSYDLNYIFHSGNTVTQLGEGIFNKVEYFPALQEETDLGDLIRTLYGNGEQGVMYIPEPKVLGQQVLWQDAAGTVPVVSDGDPVGLMIDLSGNDNHATQSTSAARPIYRTDGVLHWLEFDGVDDRLVTSMRIPFPVSLAVAMEMDNASNVSMYSVGGGYVSGANRGYGLAYSRGDFSSQARTNVGNIQPRFSAAASQKWVACSLFDNVSGSVSLHSNLGDDAVGDTAFDPSVPTDNFALGYPDTTASGVYRFRGTIFGVVLVSKLVEHESVNKYLAKLAGVTP